jgi:hypothetical protein
MSLTHSSVQYYTDAASVIFFIAGFTAAIERSSASSVDYWPELEIRSLAQTSHSFFHQ